MRSVEKRIINNDITICIESNASSKELINFFKKLNSTKVKFVYDTGNRYNKYLYKDILSLNHCIEHVHIKDKSDLDKNCKLGQGYVNFKEVAKALKKIKYKKKY